MWKVRYWDGSYEPEPFSNQNEAVKAARKGLQDWMNDDDYLGQNDTGTELWVCGGSDGDTDASAKLIYIP